MTRRARGLSAQDFLKVVMYTGIGVVVQTPHAPGKFRRYVAESYYLPGESNANEFLIGGKFLNQQMWDEGQVE